MVIDDHDHIGPPLLSIFRNGRKIARVRLPQTTEFRCFKCLTVFDIRVACAFQVIGLDEPLYGTLADASIDKAILNQETVDHHSGDAWILLPYPVDLLNRCVIQDTSGAFIGPFLWRQAIDALRTIEGGPLFQGGRLILPGNAVGTEDRLFRNSPVISSGTGIGVHVLDNRSDQSKPEVSLLKGRDCRFSFCHDSRTSFFLWVILNQEGGNVHFGIMYQGPVKNWCLIPPWQLKRWIHP